MDIVTIILSARQQDLWFYCAVMATVGSLLEAFSPTAWRAKEARRRWRAASQRGRLTRFTKPSTAGALAQFPSPLFCLLRSPWFRSLRGGRHAISGKKFLVALFLGRIARYTTLAFLAAHYGRHIILLLRHGHPLPLATIGLLITIAGVTFVLLRRAKSSKPAEG